MSQYYIPVQSSTLRSARADTAVNAGTFARPDSEITQTTIVITTNFEPIEYERGAGGTGTSGLPEVR